VDGLDGEWEGSICLYDARDVLHQIPFALEHLQEGWDPQTYDATSMGPSDDRQRVQVGMETNRADMKAPLSSCRTVRSLSLNTFCAKLIDHFDNMFKWHQLVWPQRLHTNN
jgi:hypothetical protein